MFIHVIIYYEFSANFIVCLPSPGENQRFELEKNPAHILDRKCLLSKETIFRFYDLIKTISKKYSNNSYLESYSIENLVQINQSDELCFIVVQTQEIERKNVRLNYFYLKDFLRLIATRLESNAIKTNQINYMFIDLNFYYYKCLNKFDTIELSKNDIKFIQLVYLKLISMNENNELDEACALHANQESISLLKFSSNSTIYSNESAHLMPNDLSKANEPSLLSSQYQYFSIKETKSYLISMFIKLFIYFACFVLFIFITLIVLHKINQRNLKKLVKKNAYISALSNQLYSIEIFSSDSYKNTDCTYKQENKHQVQESKTNYEPFANINHQVDANFKTSHHKLHQISNSNRQFSSDFQQHKQYQSNRETRINIDDENSVLIVDLNGACDYKRKINENLLVGELKNNLIQSKEEEYCFEKINEEEEGDTRSEYSITDLEKMKFVQQWLESISEFKFLRINSNFNCNFQNNHNKNYDQNNFLF
jgi:hypothetical protein